MLGERSRLVTVSMDLAVRLKLEPCRVLPEQRASLEALRVRVWLAERRSGGGNGHAFSSDSSVPPFQFAVGTPAALRTVHSKRWL